MTGKLKGCRKLTCAEFLLLSPFSVLLHLELLKVNSALNTKNHYFFFPHVVVLHSYTAKLHHPTLTFLLLNSTWKKKRGEKRVSELSSSSIKRIGKKKNKVKTKTILLYISSAINVQPLFRKQGVNKTTFN